MAPTPTPTPVAPTPTPAPTPAPINQADIINQLSTILPQSYRNSDNTIPSGVISAMQNFLNQGYTQQQIQAALTTNPNGGWGASLMDGNQGPPGAVN